jgi:hypothetical protein
MLHAVSWKEFFTVVGMGCLGWYAWLLVRYFPRGSRLLSRAALGRQKSLFGADGFMDDKSVSKDQELAAPGRELLIRQVAEVPAPGMDLSIGTVGDVAAPGKRLLAGTVGEAEVAMPEEKKRSAQELTEEVSREIGVLIAMGKEEKTGKEELLEAIGKVLKKEEYKGLKESAYRKVVMDMIESDLRNHCSIRLDAEDRSKIWV